MIQKPHLCWNQAGAPASATFGDIYYSAEDGLGEARYVFVNGNGLPHRFASCNGHFVIAEAGFGTGLNCVAAWECFEHNAPVTAHLDYIGIEKYPLSQAELAESLQRWQPLLPAYTRALVAAYPRYPSDGAIQCRLGSRVTLTLFFADLKEALAQISDQVDAWFLDGFAPARNPHMWEEPLGRHMARLARSLQHDSSSFATFTAASAVRRMLAAAGFAVQRCPGFGQKREMLCGSYQGPMPARRYATRVPPYLARPRPVASRERVAIIGAGVAGCALAGELAGYGMNVDIYEQAESCAQGASGNAAAVTHPFFSADASIAERFFTQGFLGLDNFLQQNQPDSTARATGGAVMPLGERALAAYQKLLQQRDIRPELACLLTPEQAVELTGLDIDNSCLYFPAARVLSPGVLCDYWLAQAGKRLRCYYQCRLDKLAWQAATLSWRLHFAGSYRDYSRVILAGGYELMHQLGLAETLGLLPAGGQVERVTNVNFHRAVLARKRYALPLGNGEAVCGASFRGAEDRLLDIRSAETTENLAVLEEKGQIPEVVASRVAIRCTTVDHLPVVGALPDFDTLDRVGRLPLQKGYPWHKQPDCPFQPGLYVTTGFGARGLSAALPAAQLLRALILGHAAPFGIDVQNALHPARFQVKRYKRGS